MALFKRPIFFAAVIVAVSLSTAWAQDEPRDTGSEAERIDFAELVKALKSSRHTLRDIIAATDQPPIRPLMARFYVKNGHPMIQVVTSERGYYLTADENLLTSRQGAADEADWSPARRELSTVREVSQAAMYMTLIQTSPLTLPEFIKLAESEHPGQVIAVVPESPNLEPSVEVLMLHNGQLWELDYGLDGELDERELEWESK